MIKMNNNFFSNNKKLGAPLIEYLDLNEGKVNAFENADLTETEASKLIIEDDEIDVIKTEDN